MGKIIHELQVHEIELELQNEELHRIQEELEIARTRYFDLFDLAPVGYCTISEEGIIFEDQNRQLQKAESLERMAGAIAHLFNNQLCVVLGNLDIALEDLAEKPSIRQNLVDAMQAARRSAEVSGLLLTYLGQTHEKLEPLDLSEVCRWYLPELQAAMPSGIALETDLSSPGPVVRANANQIQQVISHLLTNGWEAIGDRTGRVTVKTMQLPAPGIPQSHVFPAEWQHTTERFAVLEITDTGSGMTKEKMDRIFDPFYSTKFTGRGLGLAVATGIVKAWGGMIGVESTIGAGSIFRVFFPLAENAVPRQIGPTVEPGPWNFAAGWTVLLVDDDDVVLSVVESALQLLGVTVFTAGSGPEAIAIFQRHQSRIHCLITDLCMPDMDGWEILAALRKIRPDLPVILSSGYNETQAMSGEHTELPQAFLHKPYGLKALKNVLSRVLGCAAPKTST